MSSPGNSTQRPFLPFTRPLIDEDTIAGVVEVLRSGWITSGPHVKTFEAALSEHCAGRAVRSLVSGTAALEIGLKLAGVGDGDEVITTPLSWVATANVILQAGAHPVFADIDPQTRNIDLDAMEAAITPRTKALLPVFLSGLPVDMDKLYAIAQRRQLRVVEDAAQAFGASWNGVPIGARGDLTAFSFHANKNITTAEGGALVLPSHDDISLCEQWRLQGVVRSGEDGMEVELAGGKANLTDLAARIGLGQLPRLEEFTSRRRKLARDYFARLETLAKQFEFELPQADFSNSNWHMFQIVLSARHARPAVIAAMREQGIGIGVHYPAIHLFKLYRALGYREGQFPHTERIARAIITLPLFPAMQDDDIDRVCEALSHCLGAL